MKKTNFRVVRNTDEKMKCDGKAVVFIKSRKADHKIHAAAAEMIKMAESLNLEVTDVIVDESANLDIDRAEITKLCQMVEVPETVMIIVTSVFDFTDDVDDLLKFMEMLMNHPVMVVDPSHHITWSPEDSELDED